MKFGLEKVIRSGHNGWSRSIGVRSKRLLPSPTHLSDYVIMSKREKIMSDQAVQNYRSAFLARMHR